jgi:capsular exopolysaccharide synthesis family protein
LAVAPPDMVAANAVRSEHTRQATALNIDPPAPVGVEEDVSVIVEASPKSRLVALTSPNGLGAEKFRALVTRMDHLRKQRELKSFQVTSSMINEGKTLVAGNVAITLAKYSGSKTLLIEGDMRRPALAALLGLSELRGLTDWWSGRDPEPTKFICKVKDMPLWFLPAGKACDQPSEIIRSTRFVKAFAKLASQFEWIVVDSTPMLPIVDVNLWSKLVDGTLLVVREGLTGVKALKKGLQALDHPKWIGVVLNEAAESDQAYYDAEYCGASKAAAGRVEKLS